MFFENQNNVQKIEGYEDRNNDIGFVLGEAQYETGAITGDS